MFGLKRKMFSIVGNRKYHNIIAFLVVLLVAVLSSLLISSENYRLVPYILLFTVSILATFMKIVQVLIATTLSALVWNFFFIPPHFTFHIEKPEDILLFGLFFMIALLNGILTIRLRQTTEMANKAHESDKLYKTIFNSISHELRIPVSTIMGASENLLTNDYPSQVEKELTHEIFTASLRLNRLIENLLSMSRLEAGRISPKPDWHDINDMINKVLKDLEEELHGFMVLIKVPDDMPPVWIDFGLMEQVLYNLLFNTTFHAPSGTLISIKVEHADNFLLMDITDDGPGFPADKIEHLFDKFYRIDQTSSGGLGLGLSIVKGFVEAHQGTITASNNENGGARFNIRIPSPLTQVYNINV